MAKLIYFIFLDAGSKQSLMPTLINLLMLAMERSQIPHAIFVEHSYPIKDTQISCDLGLLVKEFVDVLCYTAMCQGPICPGPTFLGGRFAEGRIGKGPIFIQLPCH